MSCRLMDVVVEIGEEGMTIVLGKTIMVEEGEIRFRFCGHLVLPIQILIIELRLFLVDEPLNIKRLISSPGQV